MADYGRIHPTLIVSVAAPPLDCYYGYPRLPANPAAGAISASILMGLLTIYAVTRTKCYICPLFAIVTGALAHVDN